MIGIRYEGERVVTHVCNSPFRSAGVQSLMSSNSTYVPPRIKPLVVLLITSTLDLLK